MQVIIKTTTELLGTVPKDPEVYASWIETKKPIEIQENESENVEKIEEKGWTGFMKDDNGLFIYEYMIKGFLKTAGDVVKTDLGIKGIASKIDKYVFVTPRRIYFHQEEPDGFIERPLRGKTPKGPRVTLVRSDFINIGKKIEFDLKIFKNPPTNQSKAITQSVIEVILKYGEWSGLGQFRNGGYGRFKVVKIVRDKEPKEKVKSGVKS